MGAPVSFPAPTKPGGRTAGEILLALDISWAEERLGAGRVVG